MRHPGCKKVDYIRAFRAVATSISIKLRNVVSMDSVVQENYYDIARSLGDEREQIRDTLKAGIRNSTVRHLMRIHRRQRCRFKAIAENAGVDEKILLGFMKGVRNM